MDVGAQDGHKSETFVRCPPVILHPRQLPMSPMPRAGVLTFYPTRQIFLGLLRMRT